jgi:hypothetical protein
VQWEFLISGVLTPAFLREGVMAEPEKLTHGVLFIIL